MYKPQYSKQRNKSQQKQRNTGRGTYQKEKQIMTNISVQKKQADNEKYISAEKAYN